MALILSEEDEVEESACRPDSLGVDDADDAAEELFHDLTVFVAGHVGESRYTIVVYMQRVVGRKSCKALVELLRSNQPLDPFGKMLHQSLVDLMKDIGGNGRVDVGMWMSFPEGVEDWGDAVGLEEVVECRLSPPEFGELENLKGLRLSAARAISILAEGVGGALANWALAVSNS